MVCGLTKVTTFCHKKPFKGQYLSERIKDVDVGEQVYVYKKFTIIDKIKRKRNTFHMKFTLIDDDSKKTTVCMGENEYLFVKNNNCDFEYNDCDGFEINDDFRLCYGYRSVKNIEIGDVFFCREDKEYAVDKIEFSQGADYDVYTRTGYIFTTSGILIMCKKSKFKHKIMSMLIRKKQKLYRAIDDLGLALPELTKEYKFEC